MNAWSPLHAPPGPPTDALQGLQIGAGPSASVPPLIYLPSGAPAATLERSRVGHVDVVVEGWLHRRAQLASELGAGDGTSLAAIVGKAYVRWGPALLDRIDGAFAICLHDAAEGTVLAARDRLGTVPLFYAEAADTLLFSPSPDVLRRHPLVSDELNREALAAHLLGAGREITGSFYRAVRRLLPGHVLHTGPNGSPVPRRYWAPLAGDTPDVWVDEEELERFPAVLSAGVADLLELGRPGIFLSGGLDSGTIATLATDLCRAEGHPLPHAFSLVFDDPESNEEHVQRGVANGLGLPQTLVPMNLATDPVEAFHASLALNDDWPHPLASTFRSVSIALGERAVDAGCELILTGEGGDEWLALRPELAADLLRSLDLAGLRTLVETVRRAYDLPLRRASRRVLWDEALKLLLFDAAAAVLTRLAASRLHERRRRLAGGTLPAWLAPDPALRTALVERLAAPSPNAGGYRAAVVRDTLEHPFTLLYGEEFFECGRRIGAPVLMPFYRPEVVRFLVRTPPRLRAVGGRSKSLLRGLLHERFPDLGFDRQMKPYATNFFGTMMLEGLGRAWPTMGGFRALDALGIVDAAKANALVDDTLRRGALADRQAAPKTLWMLLCTERWVRSRDRV